MTESLEAYRLYMIREKGLKSSTIAVNLKLIKRLLRECVPLSLETVNSFVLSLIDNGRDPDYINQFIVALRYYASVTNITTLKEYPYCKLKNRDNYVRAWFSDDETEAFLNVPNPFKKDSVYGRRYEMWNVFWTICVYQGFRMGEVAKLRRQDVDLGRDVFVLPDTKTGHRIEPISFVIRNRMKDYVGGIAGEYLFPPLHKSKLPYMTDASWEYDFQQRIKRLAATQQDLVRRENITPYSLRHTFGTRQADEDVSIFKIQKAMGHSKLETTAKYIHMSLKGVRDMMDNDRLSLRHKTGEEILAKLGEIIVKFVSRFVDKLFMNVEKSEDGRELTIHVKVRD